MREVYLDNSATTQVVPEVAAAMQEMLTENFGNPSSLHRRGLLAERAKKEARRVVAQACDVKEQEILFTSGGTEANNLAIKGVARRWRRRGNHLLTTKIEHPSVLYAYQALEQEGFEVTYLDVDEDGLVTAEAVTAAMRADTLLVSIMHVNNEVGSILPVAEIGPQIKAKNPQTLFHVDAVQSLGKLTLRPHAWQADLLTVSAHKIHGPKGCGALYRKDGLLLSPLLHGGDQEQGVRPGTENMAGIVGFATAVRLILAQQEDNYQQLVKLKQMFSEGLQTRLPEIRQNGPLNGAPHILNLTVPDIKGEVLVHALAEEGIYLSTGSACHAHRAAPSHVLLAMGRSPQQIAASLRLSFSALLTAADVEYALEKITAAVTTLRLMTRRKP
ncbi:MAG TPA: cysteine desulfurase family protein [Oscillospiraceae bacterium]|nr:cysteine desulfurase family protein [Oscillospiraceae bacterium]